MNDNYFIILILVLIICVIYVFGDSVKKRILKTQICNCKKEIREIREVKEEVKEEMDNTGDKLMLFFATWCGHCKNFMPEWEKLKKNTDSSIKLEEIDGDKNKDLCVKYKIMGFPTILLEKKDGKVIQYNGERTMESVKTFIESNK